MKEKILNFSKGIFSYDQPQLKIEPPKLVMEVKAEEAVSGSFVISVQDERRVKGALYCDIPGFSLSSDSFFARAARIEFRCHPKGLRPGEERTDMIWLESSAGEYSIPVTVRVPRETVSETVEEVPSFCEPEPSEEKEARRGNGRSEEWKRKRQQESLLMELCRTLEKERRGALLEKKAVRKYRNIIGQLHGLDEKSSLYPLLDAWTLLREGQEEEAGWLLKKYERTRLFQQRDVSIRALFVYVNCLWKHTKEAVSSAVSQLQKMYARYPENWMVTSLLLELDPGLRENKRARYLMLERQFRAGTRSRMLYAESWDLLKEDMALFARLDAFSIQVFAWAAARGYLTPQIALTLSAQALRLKNASPLTVRLLKACYQVNPCKETAGAVCAVYIRGHRMDEEAFVWYQKGVELDARITNLYEYFMYALPEHYGQLLPRQILMYFQYHMTLTSRQKTVFYTNLVKYGSKKDEMYRQHWRGLQEFLLKQLREKRINESLAWLYEKCLLIETLEPDLLSNLADLLFLRKITCGEKQIGCVEVSYEQLKEKVTVPLTAGEAYVPVYTPNARIVLIARDGRRFQKTVPYEMKRILLVPAFIEYIRARLEDHVGMNLYQLDGTGSHKLKPENLEIAYRLLDSDALSENYRRKLQLEILEYKRKSRLLTKLEERLRIGDISGLTRKEQASYIEILIILREDEEALRLLEESCCQEVDGKLLLRLIGREYSEDPGAKKRLLPAAAQAFEKGVYSEAVVSMLSESVQADTGSLLKLWRAAREFEVPVPALEEQLLGQALFTECHLQEVFPVYEALEARGGSQVLCAAYLNYLSWLDFVKNETVPEGLMAHLEEHFLWEDALAETAALSYLRQLSVLLLLTDTQKALVQSLMKELLEKKSYYAFMESLYPHMETAQWPNDRTVVEYRCDPRHRVILHYVLEFHGKKAFDYVTEQLYPSCGGVFTRAFVLFYGERLTWFFTEVLEDGSTRSTASRTLENKKEYPQGGGRYERLCRMQKALDFRQERNLKKQMAEYEELKEITEEQFRIRK